MEFSTAQVILSQQSCRHVVYTTKTNFYSRYVHAIDMIKPELIEYHFIFILLTSLGHPSLLPSAHNHNNLINKAAVVKIKPNKSKH